LLNCAYFDPTTRSRDRQLWILLIDSSRPIQAHFNAIAAKAHRQPRVAANARPSPFCSLHRRRGDPGDR
jgi:hypothetical protein